MVGSTRLMRTKIENVWVHVDFVRENHRTIPRRSCRKEFDENNCHKRFRTDVDVPIVRLLARKHRWISDELIHWQEISLRFESMEEYSTVWIHSFLLMTNSRMNMWNPSKSSIQYWSNPIVWLSHLFDEHRC